MSAPTQKQVRALAHLKRVLEAGGNASEAVRRERPWLAGPSSHNAAARRNRRMREAFEDVDFRQMLVSLFPDSSAYARLAELAGQDRSPSAAVSALRLRERLLGRDVQRTEHRRGTLVMRAMLPDTQGWDAPPPAPCLPDGGESGPSHGGRKE